MEKKFLEEYDHKEQEEIDRFKKIALEGRFSSTDVFPPRSRFHYLKTPVADAEQGQKNLEDPSVVWSQIPFSGSLLISLSPVSKEQFRRHHGFAIEEIPDLVRFSKETGKVQFMLSDRPVFYENLHFLEPIFTELKPPRTILIPPKSLFRDEIDWEKGRAEFYQIAKLGLSSIVAGLPGLSGLKCDTDRFVYNFCSDYLVLRAVGSKEICDYVLDLMTDDVYSAIGVLNAYHALLSRPLLDADRANQNSALEAFQEFSSRLPETLNGAFPSKATLPCEVGKFVIKKVTPYVESYDGMKALVDLCEEQDLYRLMNKLTEPIKSAYSDVRVTKTELDELFDNIWKDAASFGQKAKRIDLGISLTLGIVGPIIGYIGGGLPGFAASLGLNVLDKTIELFRQSLGKGIMSTITPSWVVAAYDFQHKYKASLKS